MNNASYLSSEFANIRFILISFIIAVVSNVWRVAEASCNLLNSDHLHLVKAEAERTYIMLESLHCCLTEVPVLKCLFEENTENAFGKTGTWRQYVRDAHGEVYQVSRPLDKSKCDDPNSYVIQRRIMDARGRLVRPLCPEPALQSLKSSKPPVHQKSFDSLSSISS